MIPVRLPVSPAVDEVEVPTASLVGTAGEVATRPVATGGRISPAFSQETRARAAHPAGAAIPPLLSSTGGSGLSFQMTRPSRLPRGLNRRWCVIEGCENPAKAKGMCKKHYSRLRRTGRPEQLGTPGVKPPPLDIFMLARITIVDDCWEFAVRNQAGYGVVTTGGQHRYAHRVMYEEVVGPIPDGLHLDHLCRNPPCCNPEHLEPVTPEENNARKPEATHCKQGHEFTPENVYLRPDNGTRQCLTCKRGTATRERAVSCSRCHRSTWNDSAVCDDCANGMRDHLYCEIAAKRLAQEVLDFGAVS